ncbi:hypothetical protein HD806DRAFT_475104 [Xylariaceae sp. AK1471]|nr:hypothetical protein HD806DRAFT_475104 [Xylariaceae sp. AK1471]
MLSQDGDSKKSEERLPFLGTLDERQLARHAQRRYIPNAAAWARVYIAILHVLIATLLWALCRQASIPTLHPKLEVGRTWSPAQHLIEYELNDEHTNNHTHYTKYSGPPSDDQDKAWDELIRPIFFNVSLEEVERAEESVPDEITELADGGYLAILGVYHELHCLRQLRFWLYKDRYYPNVTEKGSEYIHNHLDHCLETLRLTIQCHANTALYTFHWADPADIQPSTKSNSRSVCAKWEPIEAWAYSRRVAISPVYKEEHSMI